jgi:glyoxylase-like metal-dependent hydrolase (beta-lactamase superfamily II)
MAHTIDLQFQQRPGVIAAGVLVGTDGIAIVDPGPASTERALRTGLQHLGWSLEDVRAILVTHIHLDHSAGAGALVREHPAIRLYVHERGAPHLVQPDKLVESAGRLYGDRMQALWGDIVPVPAENVEVLRGGEVLGVAGLRVRVAYTPGHASHHVSYFEEASGTLFAGDTGGIRTGAPLLVIPPTPPPDIDVAAWMASLSRIRQWAPARVFVTHFGGFDDPAAHLADLEEHLRLEAEWVRELLADETLDDARRQAAFAGRMIEMFRGVLPDEEWVERYTLAVPMDHCWQGLARYWRKKAPSSPPRA